MSKPKKTVPIERLREVLSYCPKSGVCRWVKSLAPRGKVGSVAGGPDRQGYVCIRIDGVLLFRHRIAWAMIFDEWPLHRIDHVNGKPGDDRIENLRQAMQQQNCFNRGKQRNNKSGLKGVYWHKQNQKWHAQIKSGQTRKSLGLYDCKHEAHEAYVRAAIELHGEFARTN